MALVPHPAEGVPATIYIDRNRDGDFLNDNPPLYRGTGTSRSAAQIQIKYRRRDGSSFPLHQWLWTSVEWPLVAKPHWFNFYTQCWKQGTLSLPENAEVAARNDEYQVWAKDPENTGDFANQRVVIDWNRNKKTEEPEWLEIGKTVRMGEHEIRLVSISPYSDEVCFAVRQLPTAERTVQDVQMTLSQEPIPGNVPPPLDVHDLSGRRISLGNYRGKVVLLDFWATWCGPCLRKLPEIKGLRQTFPESELVIIGISLDKDLDKLRQFCTAEDLTWPQHCDGEGWKNDVVRRYRVQGIPALFLIGRDGVIRAVNPRESQIHREIKRHPSPVKKSGSNR